MITANISFFLISYMYFQIFVQCKIYNIKLSKHALMKTITKDFFFLNLNLT